MSSKLSATETSRANTLSNAKVQYKPDLPAEEPPLGAAGVLATIGLAAFLVSATYLELSAILHALTLPLNGLGW
jgi:hypothetical protein